MQKIILASGSIRRKEILNQLGIPFRVVVPNIEENINYNNPKQLVKILAQQKVQNVANAIKKQNDQWIVGMDTIVVINDKIYGKPKNKKEAKQMIETLSGNIHSVISGIALLPGYGSKIQTKVVVSRVKFNKMSKDEVSFYLSTNEWKDAAGAYKIQERASLFIGWIKGSYSNIVGLPISVFYGMLKENGYNFNK